MKENQHELTPEERTIAFFEQDPEKIADKLIEGDGMVIAVTGTDKRIRIVEVESYAKEDVGKRYGAMNDMLQGDLWTPPQRQILQSLIVTKDQNGVGSCVRIIEGEYFDSTTESFVSRLQIGIETYAPREGDIARFLGLERYGRVKLSFLDNSNTLYITKESTSGQIKSKDANNQLRSLLEEGEN